jgi:hypothetical protein
MWARVLLTYVHVCFAQTAIQVNEFLANLVANDPIDSAMYAQAAAHLRRLATDLSARVTKEKGTKIRCVLVLVRAAAQLDWLVLGNVDPSRLFAAGAGRRSSCPLLLKLSSLWSA